MIDVEYPSYWKADWFSIEISIYKLKYLLKLKRRNRSRGAEKVISTFNKLPTQLAFDEHKCAPHQHVYLCLYVLQCMIITHDS